MKKQITERKAYPSDITREQFNKIESMLLSARKSTKPSRLELYDVFCGVLYVLKSGCQWRMIPSDFPDWQSIYYYFRIWNEEKDENPSLLQGILKKIGWRGPTKQWSDQEHKFSDY